jgi:hypothetical protein
MKISGLSSAHDRLAQIALVAGFLCIWIVQHHYSGLFHDSQIYTLPALARVYPELLGNDIMLRFGSQDSYTIFGTIHAVAIRVFGVETAATILTLGGQLAFFVAVLTFARRVLSREFVWLGLALLYAMDAFYGNRAILVVVEMYATPRLWAEAFVLAGLTALLSKRFGWAGVFALIAGALHPLMALAGVVAAVFLHPMTLRTRLTVIGGGLLAAAAVFAVLAMRGVQLTFDEEWGRLLRMGTDYLFPSYWTVGSWSRTSVMLGTLLVGMLVLEDSPARALCKAVLITAVIGIAASMAGGDLLDLVLVVQSQFWRWMWLATLLAVLFLPLIIATSWKSGPLWRAVALLLAGAWLCFPEVYALEVIALMLVLAFVARHKSVALTERAAKQIQTGAMTLAGLAGLYHIATGILFANAVPDQTDVPEMLRRLRSLSHSGALPFATLVALYLVVTRTKWLAVRGVLAAGALIGLVYLVPISWHEWNYRRYGQHTYEAFAPWRDRIPPGAEVLWFDSPLASWILLQRPSYLSNQQETAGLFSRQAAITLKSRVDALTDFLATEFTVGWIERPLVPVTAAPPPISLREICARSDVKYVVTHKDISATPIATTPAGVSALYKGAHLYACDTES